jgi:methylglutaconyl-CoA hydratase
MLQREFFVDDVKKLPRTWRAGDSPRRKSPVTHVAANLGATPVAGTPDWNCSDGSVVQYDKDMSELVLYERRDSAALITMNRPDRRNALSRGLIAALADAFARADADAAVRSVILTGAGTAFCAGMDLDELRGTLGAETNQVWNDAAKLSALYEQIYALPKPTIAAVNGAAVAGGAGLVTACDLAIAAADARFGYPEVRRGLVAAMVMPHLLRHVGERAARWLLLTGELIGAADAVRLGLVNASTSKETLLDTALGWCASLAEGGPKALAATKELLQRCSNQAVPMADLAQASAAPRLTEECRSGLAAFFEKKPPPWAATS